MWFKLEKFPNFVQYGKNNQDKFEYFSEILKDEGYKTVVYNDDNRSFWLDDFEYTHFAIKWS